MAWEKLDVPPADQEKILDQLETSVVIAANAETGGNDSLERTVTGRSRLSQKKAQIWDVFSSESRPRLLLAVFLMGMQQLSGIDGVLYVRKSLLVLGSRFPASLLYLFKSLLTQYPVRPHSLSTSRVSL